MGDVVGENRAVEGRVQIKGFADRGAQLIRRAKALERLCLADTLPLAEHCEDSDRKHAEAGVMDRQLLQKLRSGFSGGRADHAGDELR
jgi:hypothetical protein